MWGTKRKRWTDGTGYTRATIATWGGTERANGANGYVFFYVFFSFFLLSSVVLIILLLFVLSLFQWSISTGGYDGIDQHERRWQHGTGGRQARQVRLLLLYFFLISSFLHLTFIISFIANYSNRWGGAEWNGTGRGDADGDSNTGRDGEQAGGRRR